MEKENRYDREVKKSAEYSSQRPFWKSVLRRMSTLGIILLAGLIAYLINNFALQTYQVIGQSMEPTLQQGDYLLISKLGKTFGGITDDLYVPNRNSVIVFNSPENYKIRLIKRVIGLPGDRVIVRNGEITVYNNNAPRGFNPDSALPIDDQFVAGNVDITLDEDEIFVVGDNRGPSNSLDSRNKLGPVPLDAVIGKLILRLYPIDKVEQFSTAPLVAR